MKYKQISERNQDLLLMGAKITGTFVEGYYYNEEFVFLFENRKKKIESNCII